ncbi:hypothetical protein SEA_BRUTONGASTER_112 [Gordonia phage BrutonGaster]|uniref:Uncharacterized protein n=1 Tax=Gordonia phage BrutonGaster TaxID=2530116 RepID=A0A482JLS0_9CAUD|nr:hypothetical protein HOV26_gp070 [Gordonia phage BrutonGaster]QBP33327.1 hypothetical protein SEA_BRUTONGASTER_112 [Gordonia phage BrutonGaster]
MADTKIITNIKNAGGVIGALQAGVVPMGTGPDVDEYGQIAQLWEMFNVYVKNFEEKYGIR